MNDSPHLVITHHSQANAHPLSTTANSSLITSDTHHHHHPHLRPPPPFVPPKLTSTSTATDDHPSSSSSYLLHSFRAKEVRASTEVQAQQIPEIKQRFQRNVSLEPPPAPARR